MNKNQVIQETPHLGIIFHGFWRMLEYKIGSSAIYDGCFQK